VSSPIKLNEPSRIPLSYSIEYNVIVIRCMLLPSEIEAKSIIPAIRAILAWKLINEYGHREEDVAKALGITQAAVSNYARCARGDRRFVVTFSSIREIMHMIDDIAVNLAETKVYTPYAMSKFIEICNFIRSTLIICEVHHNIESNIDEKICKECEVNLLKE
jgi:uncharacterized protein